MDQSTTKRRIAPPAIRRCRLKVRTLTRRVNGKGLHQTVTELAAYLRGWKAYFGFCQTPTLLKDLDSRIRRRLRSMIGKHWQTFRNRFAQLAKRGVVEHKAVLIALPNRFFQELGLPSLAA
ncbi:MAG: hypothetical protein K1Y36_08915 [Blastocatellia bacterium]|nr:hypothetical protein [Blastocatellia bacterium]